MSTVKQIPAKTLDGRMVESISLAFPDLKCTITDVRFPKKDFVVDFYTFLLELLNINVQKIMTSPIENQLQGESHPEIYAETLQYVNLSQVLRTMFDILQVGESYQVGLEDLMEPINELGNKLDVIQQRKEEMEKLLAKREKLSREFNHRALSKSKRIDVAKEMKAKRLELDEIKAETKSLEQFSDKKHTEMENSKRHRTRVQLEINELRTDYQRLEAQLVQSPDALQSNYKHAQEKLEVVKQKLEHAQEIAKEKKKAIKLFESIEKDLDARSALLADIITEANLVKKCENEIEEFKSELKAKLNEADSAQGQVKGLKKETSNLSAMLTNLQLQREKTRSSMKESIRHLQIEKSTLESQQNVEMEGTKQQIIEAQAEVDDLIQENRDLNKGYEKMYAELNKMEQSFIAMKTEEIDKHHADLERARKQ